jgi:L,D-transpeptidase catalytic domain
LVYILCLPRFFRGYKPKFNAKNLTFSFTNNKKDSSKILQVRLKQKATNLMAYAKDNGYNTNYYFMVDMKIASGNKRFFVYNTIKDSVEIAGMVAHGSGRKSTGTIEFSNKPNSLCSSIGKYKIGGAYTGKFGLAFKLYGLDETNNNAINRFVVLHSHACIPDDETAPFPICESWGCPTVSPSFLNQLKKYIDQSEKPILLQMYY